jgi:hypothetical protein
MKPMRLRFEQGHGARQLLFGQAGRGRRIAGTLLLAASVAALAASAWDARREQVLAREAAEAVQAELARQGRGDAQAARSREAVLTPAQREAWGRIVGQLNTPWSDLMDALETATPDDVAVVAIEPDTRQGRVRLQVEARSLDTLLAYARQLEALDTFHGVALLKHETNDQDPNRPVRLMIETRLKPPAALMAPAQGAPR